MFFCEKAPFLVYLSLLRLLKNGRTSSVHVLDGPQDVTPTDLPNQFALLVQNQ
jgi:hypothetical protein